jgi:hypothetical protein
MKVPNACGKLSSGAAAGITLNEAFFHDIEYGISRGWLGNAPFSLSAKARQPHVWKQSV